MEEKMHFTDESNDRAYFIIVPNYILDHSSANDQALYLQMKRYAGEKGECFASESKLAKQTKLGRKALKKSIQYLLKNGWIAHKGFKPVMTKGGIQNINVYCINDIWKLNIDYYKGVSERTDLSKGVSESVGGGVQKEAKGVFQRATKKIHTKEDPIEEELPSWLNKETWNSWVAYRKDKKQSLIKRTIDMQIKMLSENEKDHIEIINQSIRNGWTGLFPLKRDKKILVYKNKEEQSETDKKLAFINSKVIK